MPDNDESPGDQRTYEGGRGAVPQRSDPQTLGDDLTFGDAGRSIPSSNDSSLLVDLSSRYKVEGTPGKGGMGIKPMEWALPSAERHPHSSDRFRLTWNNTVSDRRRP
jgi:hypothetical protein